MKMNPVSGQLIQRRGMAYPHFSWICAILMKDLCNRRELKQKRNRSGAGFVQHNSRTGARQLPAAPCENNNIFAAFPSAEARMKITFFSFIFARIGVWFHISSWSASLRTDQDTLWWHRRRHPETAFSLVPPSFSLNVRRSGLPCSPALPGNTSLVHYQQPSPLYSFFTSKRSFAFSLNLFSVSTIFQNMS